MVGSQRVKLVAWAAPLFLLALTAAFILAPWSLMTKLQGVCFGI